MKRFLVASFAIFALVTITLAPVAKTFAVTAADWVPGDIIDDVIFTNQYSMSVAQIQAFLNAEVGTAGPGHIPGVCDTNGTEPSEYGGGTRAQWAAANHEPAPPYTCLKDYYEVPKTAPGPGIPANNYGGKPIPAGAVSAAQMIWNAAQQYDISPEVLLTTIQKESAGPLITDDWPYESQYTYAMGAHCPDSGPNHAPQCDPNYSGFSIQISESAALFRYYLDNMYQPWWPYKKPGNNPILYNPNTACGSSNVNITTMATAALYTYTPYQPNATALSNLYGSQTDGCSSYGNRNFWRIFNDWFGYSRASSYAYTYVTSSAPVLTIEPGQTITSSVTLRNSGSATWYADGSAPVGQHAVRLAMRNYQNNPFADPSDPAWLGTSNQIRMTPASVAPGANATFTFNLKGPTNKVVGSTYAMYFVPVVDGVTFMPDINMLFDVTNRAASYSVVSTLPTSLAILPNETKVESVVLKNTGSSTWYADGSAPPGLHPFRLAMSSYQSNSFADPNDHRWLGASNQVSMTPASVAPGANATFTFNLKGPLKQTSQNFTMTPVLDGVAFGSTPVVTTSVSTPAPDYSYTYITATNPPSTMQAGTIANVSLTLKNTGNVVWTNETSLGKGTTRLRLMMTQPGYRNSTFYDPASGSNWLLPNQIQYTGPTVAPGQTATFTFTWKAPSQTGFHLEHFAPVLDGYFLMADPGMCFAVTVTP